MIFVLAYDRSASRLLAFDTFAPSDRRKAESRYRELLKRDWFDPKSNSVEVNIFESDSEATFRLTHARYFLSTAALIESLRETLPE